MTRQESGKMKSYEEKAEELVSLTLNACEERFASQWNRLRCKGML